MNEIKEALPILIPLVVVQLALLVFSLMHILRHNKYRFGNRTAWILIVLFVNIIGPIMYFIFGRTDEE